MRINSTRQRLLTTSMMASVAVTAAMALPAVTVVLSPSAAVAQDLVQGAISGRVTNQAQQPIGGASVTLRSVGQGFTRSLEAGADGEFRAVALPQGRYEATISAPGYNTLTEVVMVGGSGTTSLTFTLGASGATSVDEIVVVGVRRAVSEFDATTTGLTVNVEELSRNIPVARDANAIALLAPGVVASDTAFGNLPTIGGASAGENTYFVNGLNITKFRDFTGSSIVPFEFYQTLETKTGGYSSEFGRGTGGVLNGTTKSGTNEWQFGLTTYWEPDALREDIPNTYQSLNEYDESESTDVIFDFGGPIIRDRLFVFGLYNWRETETFNGSANGTGSGTRVNDPFFGGKVDFLITDNHRLEFTYFKDEQEQTTTTTQFDPVTGNLVSTDGEAVFRYGGENWITRYTGIWTDWLTTSVAYGVNRYDEQNSSPGDGCALITSTRPTDPRRGCWLIGQPQLNEDERTVFRADVDIYANFLGAHHFRIGYDSETLESYQALDYSGAGYSYCRPGGITSTIACTGEVTGGIWYRYQNHDALGPTRVRIRAYDNDGGWTSTQNAYYIQDSWQVTDQLTLNLGIRNESFENENIAGVPFVDLSDQWAPRLGATYDVFGDGSGKLFGFYGRYFLPVAVNTNQRLAGSEFFIQDTWTLNRTGGPNDANADGIHDTTEEPIFGSFVSGGNFADGTVRPISTQVDEEIDPMYVEEFILGYEQRIGDLTFAIKGTYRELGTAIDDVAIDAAVLAYCADEGITGCSSVWTGFHQYVLTNPGEDMVVTLSAADLAGTSLGAGATDRRVTLTAADLNYPSPERTYKAVELSVERDFDGVFGGRFSYTWSRNEGNYEGALKSDNGQTDPGLSQDFDQPGLMEGANGFLPNHREHSFKFFGNWTPMPNLNIGANVLIQSPRKFGCIGVHPTDLFASFYGASSWFCGGVATPRGSQFESTWLKNVDLTVSYDLGEVLNVPGDSLVVRADIFNVFNLRSQTDYNEFGEIDVGNYPGPGAADPDYRRVTGYQSPRSVRFSLAYRF